MGDRVKCELCLENEAYTICLGCGKSACERCIRFELIGSGCGCVWPAYYCLRCVMDPMINPNAAFREPENNGQQDVDNE